MNEQAKKKTFISSCSFIFIFCFCHFLQPFEESVISRKKVCHSTFFFPSVSSSYRVSLLLVKSVICVIYCCEVRRKW